MNRILPLLLSALLASCAAPTRELSQQDIDDAYVDYVAQYRSELATISAKTHARLKYEYLRQPETQSHDILVLSGGGEYGAFGAGFLKGWGKVESGEFSRPEFDGVSGISTGSLIAPFAFVGTEEAYDSVLDIYRNPDEDLVVARGFLPFLFGDRAYYDVGKLHQRIHQSITPQMIDSLAAGSAQNRNLLVGATNLDYGMMRAWDLSRIATVLDESDAIDAIAKRMIASSAIPAVFPPVKIDKFLFVDGGASMQVLNGLENREWLYQDESPLSEFDIKAHTPLRMRIWVIINNKLLMEPRITSPTWTAIAARSLASLTRASTLQTLQDIETYSQMIDSRPEFDVQLLYVAIPQEYEIAETNKLFDAEVMRDLADLGERMGADPANWRLRAIQPGAPVPENHQ